MVLQPFLFRRGQESVRSPGNKMLFKQFVIIMPIFLLDPVKRDFQVSQQILSPLRHRKEVIGGTDLADWRRFPRFVQNARRETVHRDIGIQLALFQHLQGFVLAAGDLDDLALHPVDFFPVLVEPFLHAPLVDADLFAVQRPEVCRGDFRVVLRDEQVILLRAHRQGGEQHAFRPLRRIAHVAHHVDLAPDQHLQQLRPASLDIFIIPPVVGCDLHLVFIRVSGPSAEPVRRVEGGFIPSDADDLPVRLRLRAARRQHCSRQQKAH